MEILSKIRNTLSYLFSFDAEELESVGRSNSNKRRSLLKHSYLHEYLPYRTYNFDTKLFENENSYGFAFIFPPLAGADKTKEEELELLISSLYYEGGACQFLLFADPFIGPMLGHWGSIPKGSPAIAYRTIEKRKKFFEEESTGNNPILKIPPRNFSVIFSYSVPKNYETKQESFQRKLQKLQKSCKSILTRFCQSEDLAQELDPLLLIQQVSHLVGMERTMESSAPKRYHPHLFINDQIKVGGAIETTSSGCVFHGEKSNMLFKMFQLTEIPSSWEFFQNVELVGDHADDGYRIQTPFFVHYGIFYAKQIRIKGKILSKETLLKKQQNILSFLKKNPQMTEESDEYNYALRHFEEGGKFVTTRLNIGIWGSPERFQESTAALVALYQKNGMKLKEAKFLHFDDFLRSLPMTWGEKNLFRELQSSRYTHTSMTGHVACLSPVLADFCGYSLKGIPLVSRRGQLSFFDPFSNQTKSHVSIIGPSGAGKSCFLNEMIRSFVDEKRRVFVIDKGGSFLSNCSVKNGQYISFEPEESLHLNPFSFLDDSLEEEEEGEAFNDMMETLKAIIRTMYKPYGKLADDYQTTLDQAVELAWKKKGKKSRIDDVIDVIKKHFLYATDENNAKKEKLIERLELFSSRGCYKKWLYGEKKIDFSGEFIVIETNNLEGVLDLKPVILQTYFLMISREIYAGDRSRKKGFFIDEAHNFLISPQWADVIQKGSREYRKFNAALVLATQGLEDLTTKEARKAFTNSEWVITMGSATEALPIIKKENLFPITPYEEELLLSLRKDNRFSEVAIRSDSGKSLAVYRCRLDPFSLRLFSTNPADFERSKYMREKGYSVESATEWMVPLQEKFKQLDKDNVPIGEQIETLLRETDTSILQKKEEGSHA